MITIPFSYNKLFFQSNDPNLREKIKPISTLKSIKILAFINHYLLTQKSQFEIFDLISEGWESELKDLIKYKIGIESNRRKSPIILFDKWSIIEYMKNLLLDPEDHDNGSIINPNHTLRFYISYLIFLDDFLEEEERHLPKLDQVKTATFNQVIWPILIRQYEFTIKVHHIYEGLKGYVLMSELSKHSKYSKFVGEFLENVSIESPWNFISSLLRIAENFNSDENLDIPQIKIGDDHPYKSIVDYLTLDIKEYKANQKLQLRYKGLKEKPIFKTSSDSYLILSWFFFFKQMSVGILFALFYKTSMKNEIKFEDFKSFVGKNISESRLFNAIIVSIFKSKYSIIHFDELDKGFPDAYVRSRNDIYLFEFKDYLLADKFIEDATYEGIKKWVDDRFIKSNNSKNKGISQLIRSIQTLEVSPFPFDNFIERKIKKSNINVYPVIVYDDNNLSLPGMNTYLNEMFNNYKLDKGKFNKIYPLTLISLDFLFNNIVRFRKNKFKDAIVEYHKSIKKRYNSNKKNPTMSRLFKSEYSIERTPTKILNKEVQSDNEIINDLLNLLEVPDVQ